MTRSKFAERFAQNWEEKHTRDAENNNNNNTSEDAGSSTDESGEQLDDSLTSLQWLHNITLLDITPSAAALAAAASSNSNSATTDSSPPSSPRSSSTYDDTESSSDKSSGTYYKEHTKIDYTTDPDRKPPYSYATLICMAMRETNKSKITLSAIYKWIRDNFVYYRHADPTWQNSIRHNLSLNKCFVKVARRKDEPGKGGFWKIDPAYADMFVDGVFKRRRNSSKAPRKSSTSSNKAVIPGGRSKSTSSLQHKRPATAWPETHLRNHDVKRLKTVDRAASWNLLRHSISSDISDITSYIEEEIPPYSGGLKQDLSWNTLLSDTEVDLSLRDAIDAQGIIIDHNFRVLNSPFTNPPVTASPPSYFDNDVFIPNDNLDLTIRGVGLMTPPNMPPSPPEEHHGHPWAEDPTDDVMASLDFLVSQEIGSSY